MYCKTCGEYMNDNQAVCLKCGVEAGKGKAFCPNCGKAVLEEAVICVNCGISLRDTTPSANTANAVASRVEPNVENIKQRSIVSAIILSLITCGIYGIYWYVSLTNEMNKASGRTTDTSGGACFLLGLVTCGIYNFFWAYKMGEKRDIVANEKGSSNIVYLILTLFGLGIVVYALAQDTLNKAIAKA